MSLSHVISDMPGWAATLLTRSPERMCPELSTGMAEPERMLAPRLAALLALFSSRRRGWGVGLRSGLRSIFGALDGKAGA